MFNKNVLNKYYKAKYDNLESIDVSQNEFIKLLIENGSTPKNAQMQANLALGLNSRVMIGDKMVGIRNKEENITT